MQKLILLCACLFLAIPCQAEIIYVDDDAPPGGNGQSWGTAYHYLQDALADADVNDEIRVAQGIYRPDENSADPNGTGNRNATFQLINGVTLKGGYAGLGEPDPDARDIELYETILSGEIGSEGTSDNSNHVVIGSGTDVTAVLDGFIITAGKAYSGHGGGMYNVSGSPTLTWCSFIKNWSAGHGGGIYNVSGSPTLTNCTFSENTSGHKGGAGLYNAFGSPMLTNCMFSRNWAIYGSGGGMYNDSGDSTLINCVFAGNRQGSDSGGCSYCGGGGIYNNNSNPILINCTFTGNLSFNDKGGAMRNLGISSPTLINCIFSGNSSNYLGGGICNDSGSPVMTNCILWGNVDKEGVDESAQIHGGTPVVTYSCIQGLDTFAGNDNLGDDPLFMDADGADSVIGTEDDNLRLWPWSVCADAGSNSAVPPSVIIDPDGDPRITNAIVDMGAYEGPKQGFLLSMQSIIVPEGGTTTFTVALAIDPVATIEVTVIRESGDHDITVESGGSLTFDSSNYSVPQVVTLAAAEDLDTITGSILILVSAPGLVTFGLTATEGDNEPHPNVLLVDDGAPGVNNGSTWRDAFNNLQDAMSFAAMHPDIVQIYVAQGIYRPAGHNGDRTAAFEILNDVTIKGGYAGFGEPNPDARDIQKHETILSGDLNGNDGPNFANNSENSYNVVNGNGTDVTAVLDGCTITGGNANGSSYSYNRGGGMFCSSDSTVSNSTFTGNFAIYGGGMSCLPTQYFTSPTLINCIFIDNLASEDGGGIYVSDSSPKITKCKFSENSAGRHGGGLMCNYETCTRMDNCLITGNSAGEDGGGIYAELCLRCWNMTNCTVSGNSAGGDGGGIYSQGGENGSKIINCIFWANTPDEIRCGVRPSITYTNAQGGWPGEGNLDADPCFANPENSDYHLKSQAGRWDTNSQSWVRDDVNSPCIDAGDRNSNWTAELWPHGKRINMGIYGGTPEASMSLSDAGNIADLDADGCIGYSDVMLFTNKWLDEMVLLAEDFDTSGLVNFTDFTVLAGNWGVPCEPDNPNPADGATDVDLTVDISWTAGSGATSHDVYFGTSNPPQFTINQIAAIFDSGTMVSSTTYYWRIDEVGAYGTTSGAVWSFTTMSLEASNPNPADGATVVKITSDLSWTASPCATSHNVYFGTSNPPPFIGNQTAATFDPCTMTMDTTYYWRIDEIGAYGTITGTVWRFTTLGPPPGQAGNPNPADGATDVSVITDLNWTAGSDATSHDVYFGTGNPPQFIGNQTATIFDTGTMVHNTTYYWRIDEVNPSDTTTGTIWSFKTVLPPPPPPGQARNPSPANGATEVCIYTDLGWTAGGATSHDVYFGTSNPPPFIHNQTSTKFDPCTMDCNTTYYWRIDAVNISGKTTGTVWSFTTTVSHPPLPGQASNPNPADGATGVNIASDLSWTTSPCATSHDVYFGTSNPPPFIGNQTATTFDTGTKSYETTYYWRIDERNASGTTTGIVWTFTTNSEPPPPPPPP